MPTNKLFSKKGQPKIAIHRYRLSKGEILIDNTRRSWILGESIGVGGFGEVYLAKQASKANAGYEFVIKVDNQNGPLFNEIHFYNRVAKSEYIQNWVQKKGSTFLGMPSFVASGLHGKEYNDIGKPKSHETKKLQPAIKYRFLVLPRLGTDLQKILDAHKQLSLKTAYTISIKIIDILEYIHSFGYVHCDIKASNLLLSLREEQIGNSSIFSEVYLVDFGLVERFISKDTGVHKKLEKNVRRDYTGTAEFSSRDAHDGCFSRRSDIEILCYNILFWVSGGRLPWMFNLKDSAYVEQCKRYYMKKKTELLDYCFGWSSDVERSSSLIPPGIDEFIEYTNNLKFEEEPDYNYLKLILKKAIIKSGEEYDGLFFFISERISYSYKPRAEPHSNYIELHQQEDDIFSISKFIVCFIMFFTFLHFLYVITLVIEK